MDHTGALLLPSARTARGPRSTNLAPSTPSTRSTPSSAGAQGCLAAVRPGSSGSSSSSSRLVAVLYSVLPHGGAVRVPGAASNKALKALEAVLTLQLLGPF
jgi:hypothetical protein